MKEDFFDTDINKVLRSYYDEKRIKKAIRYLSAFKDKGLEDLETLSSKKVVSPENVCLAIDMFREHPNGEYLCNILKDGFFTAKEQKVIAQHLY